MNKEKKNPITPLAITDYRDIRKRFGIKEENRRGHIYIIGKTGTGKTTLLENMIASDIKAGKGVALIDPHGDLADRILDHIPKRRIKDTIYFNPGDLKHPIAFNPFPRYFTARIYSHADLLTSIFSILIFSIVSQ